MAHDEFEEFQPEEPSPDKKSDNTLVTLAVFAGGILLLITLLYFAY